MSTEKLSTVNNPLLTEKEIEEQTEGKVKAVTLRNWRSQGKYREELPYIKLGSRVYYRRSVLEAFLSAEVSI